VGSQFRSGSWVWEGGYLIPPMMVPARAHRRWVGVALSFWFGDAFRFVGRVEVVGRDRFKVRAMGTWSRPGRCVWVGVGHTAFDFVRGNGVQRVAGRVRVRGMGGGALGSAQECCQCPPPPTPNEDEPLCCLCCGRDGVGLGRCLRGVGRQV